MSRYPAGSRQNKPVVPPPAPPAAVAPRAPATDVAPPEIELPVEIDRCNRRGLVKEFFEISFNNSHLRYSKGAMIDADYGLYAFLETHKVPVQWKDLP